jgi:hypothetical protein
MWVRLFGRETPGGWTDRGPHVPAAGTSPGSADLTDLTDLTGPASSRADRRTQPR